MKYLKFFTLWHTFGAALHCHFSIYFVSLAKMLCHPYQLACIEESIAIYHSNVEGIQLMYDLCHNNAIHSTIFSLCIKKFLQSLFAAFLAWFNGVHSAMSVISEKQYHTCAVCSAVQNALAQFDN